MIRSPHEVEYRDIPGCPGFRADSDGSVWSQWYVGRRGCVPERRRSGTWRKVEPCVDRTGYFRVNVWASGKRACLHVHRLVLEAFVGPRPDGMECRHLDGVKTNNILSNLCWGTAAENAADSVALGRIRRGSVNHFAKLTEESVSEIRSRRRSGERIKDLAAEFGLTHGHVSAICRGVCWAWLISSPQIVHAKGTGNGRAEFREGGR